MLADTVDYKQIINWVRGIWANSLAVVIMFFVGMSIGQVQTEIRFVGDCKYAGAFRVDTQAFTCQRKI